MIKLGGSLSHDPRLANWLEMLAEFGAGRVVIVPGGGPYADAVRAQQQRWKFSDEHAHRMAVLAMNQFALQLQGINPQFLLAATPSEISQALANDRIAIWLPSIMALGAPGIAMNWDVTSDSFAAWLARILQADRLVLVKSCPIPASATSDELATLNIVDRGFVKMTADAAYAIQVVAVSDLDRVRRQLIATQ